MAKERREIPLKDTWNLGSLYPSLQEWEGEFARLKSIADSGWVELMDFRGKLDAGPDHIVTLLIKYFTTLRSLDKLYTYAQHKHDEDTAHEVNKQTHQKIVSLYHDFSSHTSWIEPELLQMEEKTLKGFVDSDALGQFHWYLKKLLDQKEHVLSLEGENLLAMSSRSLSTAGSVFRAFDNADLKFPPVKDGMGAEHELTHGSYSLHLKSKDRSLRESAFKTMHSTYIGWENTLAELLSGTVNKQWFKARARKFPSCVDAALFHNQIDVSVYRTLIKTIRDRIDVLHRYISYRKGALGLNKLHTYDLYVTLGEYDKQYSYKEACDLLIESFAPLGTEYQQSVRDGLLKDRWVDVYENKRKRSGGYSGGCYDSFPFILLNFHELFSDMMTLAHEVGHSMHSKLADAAQPYQYAGYSIFVAEIASTFNERLLYEFLLEKAETPEERAFILNHQVDGIRATFFRQALFAEFELIIHEAVEKSIPLTPQYLKDEYTKLCQEYYGPDFAADPELGAECLRIPHFYSNFYVYQYATGISAAYAFTDSVRENGSEDYLKFLSAGGSDYPLNLLRKAGIDMTQPSTYLSIIDYFDSLVKKLENNH